MVRIQVRKDLSATEDTEASERQSRNGQAVERNIEDYGSGHLEESGREGNVGGGFEEDLRKMGCHGLIQRLWCIKYEKIM